MTIEDKLKDLIIERYGSVVDFADAIGMSTSTAYSILTRGVNKASVSNIISICRALHISTDELADGRISPVDSWKAIAVEDLLNTIRTQLQTFDTITLSGSPLTEHETRILLTAFELSVELIQRNRGVA